MNSTPDFETQRATILVVDDTPQELLLLGKLLQSQYQVRATHSGEAALAAITAEQKPDLILLDVMMPGLDGMEVLRRLKCDPDTCDIPVIFVTALQDQDDEQHGFELGAADYIHKPIKAPIVLSRIRAQLDAKAARDMLKRNNLRLVDQVTEGKHALEQAQLQLLQSEKMAAMGQLAAGVAHEINNPIGFINSNLGTLQQYLEDIFTIVSAYERVEAQADGSMAFGDVRELRQKLDYDFLKQDISHLMAESMEGISRVRQIVKDLKDFAHVGDTDWQWADIHRGIDSTLNIIKNELKYHCTVTKNYGSVPSIWCLPSQLNQVFMNLLVNASQAIEGKGEITVTTVHHDDDTVKIVIADSGKGIAPDDLPHIFEPFFTTKPIGKGTGLGLSVSWSIVERHGGKIKVASEPGRGTTFTLTLPINPKAATTTTDPGSAADGMSPAGGD